MKLKQIREMNCGCSVTDGAITMCFRHEAGPKLWKAAERLLRTHDDTHVEENGFTLTKNMVRALFVIEEILGDGEDAYKLIEAVSAGVPGENQNHQPKLS